ncbi:hypothetical protein Y1Q_0002859 [Alligator mississippiensis]|uniref:Reverse transcriptase domain-containing protein n=1 Tax=Alligator mississippiensis TaxID=8496 RepID=A0A151P0S8_ALLMI|nr:hypothetical protein Y1Q_0002859 [Alligator mississippiensis]
MSVNIMVQVNRFLSTQIAVELGVWQGCPLFLILFICAIKPLAQHLRQEPGICGVYILGGSSQEAKVLAYMDDLNILCLSKWSADRALWHMQVWEVVVGAKVNSSKSIFLAVAKLGDLESLDISVTHEEVKILGVEFNCKLSSRSVWEKTEK